MPAFNATELSGLSSLMGSLTEVISLCDVSLPLLTPAAQAAVPIAKTFGSEVRKQGSYHYLVACSM